MFEWFKAPRKAEDARIAIFQLVHMLSHSKETMGTGSVAGMLRKIGAVVHEEEDSAGHLLHVVMPIPEDDFDIRLVTNADECHLSIRGGQTYAGFSSWCPIPSDRVFVELRPDVRFGVTRRARLLFDAIKGVQVAVNATR
ncbi:hypothetical protein [Bradyrhizobium sp. 2TAF24]|uniref:hypothetical protein n=1 Tax=Bradyrhizobium sp. 2TAF24 TaxID=3233011 RepID=UPI003F91101F